jgi:hypothetical protein
VLRRPREVQFVGHRDEMAKLTEFHRPIMLGPSSPCDGLAHNHALGAWLVTKEALDAARVEVAPYESREPPVSRAGPTSPECSRKSSNDQRDGTAKKFSQSPG